MVDRFYEIANGLECGTLIAYCVIVWLHAGMKGRDSKLLHLFSIMLGFTAFQSLSYFLCCRYLALTELWWRILNLCQFIIIPVFIAFMYRAAHVQELSVSSILKQFLLFASFPLVYALFPRSWVFYGLYLLCVPLLAWGAVRVYRASVVYQCKVKQYYSQSSTYSLNWLVYFLISTVTLAVAFLLTCLFPSKLTDGLYCILAAFLFVCSSFLVLNHRWAQYIPNLEDQNTPEIAASQAADQAALGNEETRNLIGQHIQELEAEGQFYLAPNVNLVDMAKMLGTNERYLSDYLNRVVGKNFYQYINDLRIAHAVNLISTTQDSLESIAVSSGYEHYSRFHRQFIKRMGMTASDYRMQHTVKSQKL